MPTHISGAYTTETGNQERRMPNPFQPGRQIPPGRNAKAAMRFGHLNKKPAPKKKKGKVKAAGKKKYPPMPNNPMLAAMAAAGRGA